MEMPAGRSDKILAVPYYSQYLDIKDSRWIVRACGLACLKMALDYHGAKTPALDSMIEKAVAMGAYGDSGWYHDGLVAVAREYGSSARREEDMAHASALREAVDRGELPIVSVVQRLLGRKKYHQVLVTGYRQDENKKLCGFFYHDPASTDREAGKNLYVELGVFRVYWRKKAIFVGSKG